jgi:GT2 family glycosyltransferase
MTSERSPVIVTGMHRSGTSLVASILAACGVDMGDRLLAADRHNPRGYFEDVEILDLQREMLHAATVPDDGGHRDWGWTESERLDRERFANFTERARALVAAKSAGPDGFWGWKEPRTTLALDFWDALLDDARYVLVYRFPWEVADSMQRLGADVFLRRPDYAYRIWAFYNRHLLDFYRRHKDRCLLLSTDALQNAPETWIDLVRRRLGVGSGGTQPVEILAPDLFQRADPDDPLGPLAAATHPDCAALLAELDRCADVSGKDLWASSREARYERPAEARLSVVIPCFDHGELLVEAVASVERAVGEPCELIIVNDGSREPRTLEVLEALRRAGYPITDQENRGLAAARNRGIEQARTPYVLPLDADNRLRPGFVGPALEALEADPQVGAVYGDRRDFGLRSETLRVGPFDLDSMLVSNSIDACAVLRKEVWSACGGYDPHMPAPGLEDWDLWLGAAERGWQLRHLPVEAQDYRVRPGSMITLFADEVEERRRVERYVIAKHEDLYRRRLPDLLIAAQRTAEKLWHAAKENQAGSTLLAALEAEQADWIATRDNLTGDRERLLQEIHALCEERWRWEEERESFRRELKAWQERVATMEGTRAWRLRQRLVDLKRALRGASIV